MNTGAEAVENAVKIARTATGRPAVVVFDNAFHGRTLLAMTMTSKVKPYKAGFGPFAPEVYRAPAPYPYHGISSDDSIAALEHLFKADVDPATVACVVLEPVQGEGGFVAMPPDYPERLHELCRRHGMLWVSDEVQSGVGRTGTMWAIEQYPGAEPDLTVFGKSIGGGLPLAGVTGGADVMDSVPAGGLGGTFGGNPLSCAAALAVLDLVSDPEFLAGARQLGDALRARLDDLASRHSEIGEVRGLGSMLAFEFVERTPDRAAGRRLRGVRAGPRPALLRAVRQRHPAPAAAHDRGRRARRGPRDPGGVAWRPDAGAAPDVSVRGLTQTLRRRRRGRRGRPRHRRRASSSRMLGPSGSGKTTTLRMIAGFETPDEGTIRLAGEDVSRLPPYDRPVNTVFQDYALFPHMTVRRTSSTGSW